MIEVRGGEDVVISCSLSHYRSAVYLQLHLCLINHDENITLINVSIVPAPPNP